MTSVFLDEDFFMQELHTTPVSRGSQSQAEMDRAFVETISDSHDPLTSHDPPVPRQAQPRPERAEPQEERHIPEYLEEFWQTAPDRIKRIGVEIQPVPTTCMEPRKSDINKMYSCSKCFRLVDGESNLLLCSPTQSPAFVFMAECRTEIPAHIQAVLYFFNALSNDISNFQFFALPTKHATISANRKDPKEISFLVSTSVESCKRRGRRARPSNDHIDLEDVIEGRFEHTNQETKTPIQPFELHLGFTGVVFESNGEERRKTFAFATITHAVNFALWSYINEVFLRKPKKGATNYAMLQAEYREHLFVWNQMMSHEISHNLGITHSDFGTCEDYKWNYGGRLGVATVLNPMQVPLKIFHRIITEFPEAKNIRILGMHEMKFTKNDNPTLEWIRYMQVQINVVQDYYNALADGLDQFHKPKDKTDKAPAKEFEPIELAFPGGWPLQTDEDGEITCFSLTPFPMQLLFDLSVVQATNQDTWLTNMGGADGIPEIVKAILRSFLTPSMPLDEFPEISHFLVDKREITPKRVTEKYHSSDTDPVQTLMVESRLSGLFAAHKKDMAAKREQGSTPDELVHIWEQYLSTFPETIGSAIRGNMFRSKVISQMLDICDSVDWSVVCTEGDGSIHAAVSKLGEQIPNKRKHSLFHRSIKAFWKTWEEANKNLALNSGNLVFVIESMISNLIYKFGSCNESWTTFFAAIMVIGGNSHFETNTPTGVAPDTKKPNTTGFDFSVSRLRDVMSLIYDLVGITEASKMYMTPMIAMRWTPTAFENMTSATLAGNQVVDQPSDLLNGRGLVASEMRGQTMDPLIQAISRGEQIQTAALNSADPNKNNIRVGMTRFRVAPLAITAISTNTQIPKEQANTLSAVTHIMPPGSGPYVRKRKADGEMNSFTTDNSAKRNTSLENKTLVRNMIPFTHTVATVYLGLPNTLGIISFEIPVPIQEYFEWACLNLKTHFGGIMHLTAMENFNRMKEGYKTRTVMLSLWVQTIATMSQEQEKNAAVRKMLMSSQVNPMPLAAVPIALTSLTSRCVHMGGILLTSIFARHFGVPTISWNGLREFFNNEAVPTEGMPQYEYNLIRQFVGECIEANRFCPDENRNFDVQNNVSCYITSDGARTHEPKAPKKALLRCPESGQAHDGHDDADFGRRLLDRVASKIRSEFGDILFRVCHMGPEVCVIKNALEYMMSRFIPDFRNVLSPKMFHSRRHLTKLRFLHLVPGLADYDDAQTPQFIRTCQFFACGEARSSAVGVNIWSLLAVVSLIGGSTLHPHVNDDVARHIVERILANSPTACTPGNSFSVRSFNVEDCKNEELLVQKEDRPEHFLRPYDNSFAISGILPVGKAVDQFLPEDMLHCAFLARLKEILHCQILEIPARAVQAEYEFVPDRHYSFHHPGSKGQLYGTIFLDSAAEKAEIVEFVDGEPSEAASFSSRDVNAYIRDKGFVCTPMLWRKGCCMKVEMEGKVIPACLLSQGPDTRDQFDHTTCKYKVLVSSDLDTMDICFLDVLAGLVPAGEIFYMDMGILPDNYKKPGCLLKTRLTVPNTRFPEEGKIYVTCYYKPRRVRHDQNDDTVMIFAVNPWDLVFASEYAGDHKSVYQKLG